MKAFQFNVHDILETPGYISTRIYSIVGIHLGALGQENVLELCPIDRNSPDAHGKRQHMFAPMEMIEAGLSTGLFTLTKLDD